jgi:hypothetical protein
MKKSTYILFNDERFDKELGMLPINKFWLRSLSEISVLKLLFNHGNTSNGITYRFWSSKRKPKDSGIEPFKLFLLRFRVIKFARFPNSCGITPVMLLPSSNLKVCNKQKVTKCFPFARRKCDLCLTTLFLIKNSLETTLQCRQLNLQLL